MAANLHNMGAAQKNAQKPAVQLVIVQCVQKEREGAVNAEKAK